MDIKQLRTFQSIAELGGYSRAAAALRVTQPALSRQMRRLEDDLGVALLEPVGRGVRLTAAGQHLLERSRGLLREFGDLREDVIAGGAEPSGHVSIGTPPAVGTNLLPALIEQFRGRYPRVGFEILSGFSSDVQNWLLGGKIDLGVLHNPELGKGVTTVPLLRERVCLIGPGKGVFRPRGGSVSLADIAHLPLILPRQPHRFRSVLDREAARQGLRLRADIEADGHAIIKALVRAGLGYTIDTMGAARDDMRDATFSIVPIRPKLEVTLYLAFRPDRVTTQPLGELVRMIPAICRDSVRSGAWPARQA